MSLEGSTFQFQIKESVYFQENSAVQVLETAHLIPEVEISSVETYVSIKGALLLHGLYEPLPSMSSIDLTSAGKQSEMYVESIRLNEEQKTSFFYKFPIEVAVPEERITALEDVEVIVDTFEYEMPTNDQLNVSASIHIYGIMEEDTSSIIEVSEKEGEHTEPNIIEKEDIVLEAEEDISFLPLEELYDYEEVDIRQDDSSFEQIEEDQPLVDKAFRHHEPAQSPEEGADRDEDEPTNFEEEQVCSEVDENNRTNEKVQLDELEVEADIVQKEETKTNIMIHEKEAVEEIAKASETEIEAEVENTSALTPYNDLANLFDKTDIEDQLTALQMYIVQENDTIDAIAERYELQTNDLIQYNHFLSKDLSPGQLIYIPQ